MIFTSISKQDALERVWPVNVYGVLHGKQSLDINLNNGGDYFAVQIQFM